MAKFGYIGNQPDASSVIIARESFAATGVQTDFTFAAGYTPGYLDVYFNGAKLIDVEDYTATNGNTVGLTSAATSGDTLELVSYKAFNVGTLPTIGISSGGDVIADGISPRVTTLNFVGLGNTFLKRGNVIDVSISGGGGSVGISSNSLSAYVGTGVTHINFIGAAVTAIGAGTTTNVTINKTLTIGTRAGAANLNVTSGIATIALRTGLAGTIRF